MIKTYSHYCFIILAVAATATATTTITTSVSFWSNGLFFPEIKDFFGTAGAGFFLLARCPSCCSTNSVKVLQGSNVLTVRLKQCTVTEVIDLEMDHNV